MNRQVPYPITGVPAELPAGGGGLGVFDGPDAMALNRARLAHLESLGLPLSGKSVLDAGCGVGHLARFFVERGCRTVCVDARSENIDRLRALYPDLEAAVANVETGRLADFGVFDIVFCYGLLYHLANPVAGLANIAGACGGLLLLETMIADHPLPLCRLADEPSETLNQAVGGMGSRPTPAFVAMALTRLGFPFVYAPLIPPGHPDFEFEWRGDFADSRDGHLLRCIFVASRSKLENSRLALLSGTGDLRPPDAETLRQSEFALLSKLIAPGMVAIDAAASDGRYTLFLARRVGETGRVLAFEPRQREFSRLRSNVELNRLQNVQLFSAALSNQDGEAQLRIAGYEDEGRNTLAGFAYEGVGSLPTERVQTLRLDSAVAGAGLARLDFLKIDVEGGETRLLQGAQTVLRDFRPVILFEVLDSALRQLKSSREELAQLLREAGYLLYAFDPAGLPVMAGEGGFTGNMLAAPAEKPLPSAWCGTPKPQNALLATAMRPGLALWRQRWAVAESQHRIRALRDAVDAPGDLSLYQYAQLLATVLEFKPDLILDLGRGRGNSTCLFTEAANQLGGSARVISICQSEDWESHTLERLRAVVPDDWFKPLTAIKADILQIDYSQLLEGAGRVLLFWDASGFDVAECVLGAIMPLLAPIRHLILMHDISDSRRVSSDHMSYGNAGLWKGGEGSGAAIKIGVVDSNVEQSIAALDFTTRNGLTFESADQSFHTDLSPGQRAELRALLGELFDTQGHWFYFTLNERPGPYHFPRFTKSH
jgi:FkbM family methyltransferase